MERGAAVGVQGKQGVRQDAALLGEPVLVDLELEMLFPSFTR